MHHTTAGFTRLFNKVYRNGSQVIIQKAPIFLSEEMLVVGGFFLCFSLLSSIFLFLTHPEFFSSFSLRTFPVQGYFSLFWLFLGILLVVFAKRGVDARKDHGGIHPLDALYTLDGTTQRIIKQQQGTETELGTFEKIGFILREGRQPRKHRARLNFHLLLILPDTSSVPFAMFARKEDAETFLHEIKNIIHFTK